MVELLILRLKRQVMKNMEDLVKSRVSHAPSIYTSFTASYFLTGEKTRK